MPYEPVAVWLLDQWRQIGVTARHESLEAAKWDADRRSGNFEVVVDTQCGYVVEPDLDLYKFLSTGVSDNNYARYTDSVLDELYRKQSRAVDLEERKRYVREFERRLLDEEAHYLYTLQWHRIVPHSVKLRGWTITPSHFLNQQLDAVWLAE
jgi:peptide/nickel transport system substrate-binding protein